MAFPMLQPIRSIQDEVFLLSPWESSGGAIVFEVRFVDVLSLIPGSEYSLGEVAIPLSNLVDSGEIHAWYKVLDVGTIELQPVLSEEASSAKLPSQHSTREATEIMVRIWTPLREPNGAPSETDREASVVIQEELVKSAAISRQRKLSVIGSSIGAFNTVRGLSDNLLLVQNALGLVLDYIESLRNLLSFTAS